MDSHSCAGSFDIERHLEAELSSESSWTCKLATRIARLVPRNVRSALDESDLRQELLAHLWAQREHYDRSRATYPTFARDILQKKKREICRSHNALKRGGNSLQHSIDRTVHAGPRIISPEEFLANGEGLAELRELRMDVRTITGNLSGEQVHYCQAKMAGATDEELASQVGHSLRFVHWLKDSVAEQFAAEGFSN